MASKASNHNVKYGEPFGYKHNPDFDEALRSGSKHAEIVAPMPGAAEYEAALRCCRPPPGVGAVLVPSYLAPIMTFAQSLHQFRKMNYLKFLANRALGRGDAPEYRRLFDGAVAVRELLILSNYRLVLSHARRASANYQNILDYGQLANDAALALIRAVDMFDYGFGNHFTTYATISVSNETRRAIGAASAVNKQMTNVEDFQLEQSYEDERVDDATAVVQHLMRRLPHRERQVIMLSYGIGGRPSPGGDVVWTLEEMAGELGVSRERVRQIRVRALAILGSMKAKKQLAWYQERFDRYYKNVEGPSRMEERRRQGKKPRNSKFEAAAG